jgi:hypothetical protein
MHFNDVSRPNKGGETLFFHPLLSLDRIDTFQSGNRMSEQRKNTPIKRSINLTKAIERKKSRIYSEKLLEKLSRELFRVIDSFFVQDVMRQ